MSNQQTSDGSVMIAGFRLPPPATFESLPQWPAFAEFHKEAEGFEPDPGDSMVRIKFEYWLGGGWEVQKGQP